MVLIWFEGLFSLSGFNIVAVVSNIINFTGPSVTNCDWLKIWARLTGCSLQPKKTWISHVLEVFLCRVLIPKIVVRLCA